MPELTWWHLSAVPLGPVVVLQPQRPRDPMPGERSRVRRVCVAPTIAGCAYALRNTYYRGAAWYVYRVEGEPRFALGVPDAEGTGEQWMLTPVRATYAGQIPTTL